MKTIKIGDIIEVLGETDEDNECYWFGEVVGYDQEQNGYELYYIEEDPNEMGVWRYNEHYDVIAKESINRHAHTKRGDYETAWRIMGFVMHRTDGKIHFTPTDSVYSDTASEYSSASADTLSSMDTWSTEERDEDPDLLAFIDDSFVDVDHQPRVADQSTPPPAIQ